MNAPDKFIRLIFIGIFGFIFLLMAYDLFSTWFVLAVILVIFVLGWKTLSPSKPDTD